MAVVHPAAEEEDSCTQASPEGHSCQIVFSESPTMPSSTDPVSGSSATTTIAFSSQPMPSTASIYQACTKPLCSAKDLNFSSNKTRNSDAITPSPLLTFSVTKRAVSQFSATRSLSLSANSSGKLTIGNNQQKSGINLSVPIPPPKKSGGSLEVVLHRRNRAHSTSYGKSGRKNQSLLLQGTDSSSHPAGEKRQLLYVRGHGANSHTQVRDNLTLVINSCKASEKAAALTADNSVAINNAPSSETIAVAVARILPAKADEIIDYYTRLSRAPSDSRVLTEDNTLNKRLFNAYYKLSLKNNIGNLVVPSKVTTLEAYVNFMEAHLA